MLYVRFTDKTGNDKTEKKGILDNGRITQIYGSFFQTHTVTQTQCSLNDIILLSPVLPLTIICTESNTLPAFIKSPASVTGSGKTVKLPPEVEHLYVLPRLCHIIMSKNEFSKTAFTWMLDFSVFPAFSGLDHSHRSFTVMGPAMVTGRLSEPTAILHQNTTLQTAFDFSINRQIPEQIKPNYDLYPGDIIALAPATGAPVKCNRGTKLSLQIPGFLPLEALIDG